MVTGIGETVLDVIFRNDKPEAAVPGGSTFNALISLGRAFRNSGYDIPINMVTEVGDDHIGDIITSFMKDNGVSDSAVTRNRGTQTHVSMAFLNERNDAEYEFFKDHTHASLDPAKISGLEFSSSDYVLFGSYFAINPKLRHSTAMLLKSAKEAGATIYYDINFRRNHLSDLADTMDNIVENCHLSTFVRGSDEDFGFLFGTKDPETVYVKHISPLCRNFICTCGAQPVHVFTPDFHLSNDTLPVETASTIGAGDSFNAGFIFGLISAGYDGVLDETGWKRTIETAGKFSANVCRSVNNYIDEDFKL